MFKEVTMMFHAGCMMLSLAAVLVAMVPLPGTGTYAQDNPYRIEEGWGTLPGGRKWGGTIGVDIDAMATSGYSSGAEAPAAPDRA